MTARTKTSFGLYSTLLFLMPLAMILLLFVQRSADRYLSTLNLFNTRDIRTAMLLYAIYISGLCCCIVGFSLHFASSVLWCERYGLIPCFAMLGLSKVFLYLFFLRRAKYAQGMNPLVNKPNKCLNLFYNYIGPLYLFAYWMIYCVLTAIVFSGSYSHDAISNCNILGSWAENFSIFAGFIELFNSTVSVIIFTYPLLRTMYQVKLLGPAAELSDDDHGMKLEFIAMMKWNVALTAIASLSSVTNLFMLLVAGHFIWLFCLGDPLINGLCVFFMIASNRAYIAHRFGCEVAEPKDGNTLTYDIQPESPAGSAMSKDTVDKTSNLSTGSVKVIIHEENK